MAVVTRSGAGFFRSAANLQEVEERRAEHELHHDAQAVGDAQELEGGHDVRVANPRGDVRFVEEHRDEAGLLREGLEELLDGDHPRGLAGPEPARKEHACHAARRQLVEHGIPPRPHRATRHACSLDEAQPQADLSYETPSPRQRGSRARRRCRMDWARRRTERGSEAHQGGARSPCSAPSPDRKGEAMKAWAFGFGTILGGVMLLAGCGSPGNDTFGVLDAGHDDVTLKDAGSLRMGGGNSVSCSGLTCARLGYTCGITGDGCGGMLDCGTCVGPETCGGGGKFSVCGGSGPCTPKTCSDLGATCGPQGDGCGNLLQCGSCTAPDICGGGGTPSTCGGNGAPHPDGGLDGGPCVPITCASLGFSCGPAGDGCGNVIQCGSCTNPGDTCGGGGTNGQCGQQPTCTPATCGSLGFNCGPAGDGCGGVLQCGSCSGSDICGGGGQPGVCGDAVPCTNLCPAQKICGSTNTTTLTGTVVAGTLPTYVPSGQSPDPIPNVIVYVPNGTPAAFTPGIECQACGADVTGDPLIETTTDYKGNFTLTNVPVPSSGVIPLVIQLGRWRRIFGLGNALNPGVKVTSASRTTSDRSGCRAPSRRGTSPSPRSPPVRSTPWSACS